MTPRADSTHRIGTVAAVESERVTVEIDPEATGLVKAGTAGVLPVGAVNSYVTIAAGSTRVVAVVTAMKMVQDLSTRSGGTQVQDVTAAVSRTIEATMVGRLEGSRYEPGLTTYPSIFAPVSVATRADLELIFRPEEPSFRIGEAVVAPDQDVWLHANRLLGHHFAVLGTTGSGKSCSVMAIIDGLMDLELPSANIVVFDTNGEYAPCFSPDGQRGARTRAFVVGPEPGPSTGLFLPQWFMNTDEHLELLRAAEGVQAPLLQRAVADARVASLRSGDSLHRLRVVRRAIENIETIERTEKKIQEKLINQFAGLEESLDEYLRTGDELADTWTALRAVLDRVSELNLNDASWDPLNAPQLDRFQGILSELRDLVRQGINALGLGSAAAAQDFDAPSYYSLEDLSELFLPQRIEIESSADPRIASFAVSMQLRLSRLLADERYSFMTRVAPYDDALALFLRLLFGKTPLDGASSEKPPPWKEAYKESGAETGHAVTVIDLSLVSQDVLTVVTALIARLILELVQRLEPRAEIPVLVILEEAHRYVRRDPSGTRSQASVIFERIAKEGRKFGVALGLATQRPSELDPTVLSQCGTLIAHRTVGQVDQELIRAATPLASRDVLRQLPGLATQHAVILGEAIPAPAVVRVRHINEPPDSHDPSFVARWAREEGPEVVEAIDRAAREWETGTRRRTHVHPIEEGNEPDVTD